MDTGIHIGDDTVQESGLLGVFIAQVVCIAIYVVALLLYSSPHFAHSLNQRHHTVHQGTEDEDNLPEENFEPLSAGSEVLLKVRGVQHTYSPGCFSSMCNKEAKPTEVLTGLEMDICRGEVFGYLGMFSTVPQLVNA